jgi:hypothetical protein
MKTPSLWYGAKVWINVAMTVMKQPMPIAHLRPKRSAYTTVNPPPRADNKNRGLAVGPPRNHPATIAPIEYVVLTRPRISPA